MKPVKHTPVFDASMHFEAENKDIVPVHESKSSYPIEQFLLKDAPLQEPNSHDSVTLEINTNNSGDSVPEEIETTELVKSDIIESTDEVSVNDISQTIEVKQRRNKRRLKCKKTKNKPENCEGKLPSAGDK